MSSETSSRTGRYAIVGIGCRFPGGAGDAAAFWNLLAEGRDAIAEIPEDRPEWRALYDPDPAAAGRIYARLGGFIDGIDKFDARFFGISPREAAHIDPQHRFLLETVWQAFEDARIPLDRLAGSDTGVFVGISTHDYADVQMYPENRDRITAHSNSGGATSIAANRISFTYDLRGPSLAVDTACSSALTAVHLACKALDAGDCSLAVAGGVQLLLRPELTVGFCRATMLSVDGHCKAFDAAANGYVRSEGVGAVVLKPLDRALADGDSIYAVILGSAINQDGRTSSLTVPNEASQQAMLRDAIRRAGVDPPHVDYVEAHGTGTPVGDPIEARAIGTVFGVGRPDGEPLRLGSVKTNIGHLEAASGIAGLIKTALAIRHRQIPPSLHFQQWNPAIDPAALKLRVVTSLEPWPESAVGPVAAINSFGFGGANASVVLGAAPARAASPATDDAERAEILAISAQTPEALRSLTLAYSERIQRGDAAIAAICGAAMLGRSHRDHRIAVVATGRDAMLDALDAAAAGDNAAYVARGRASEGAATKLAFVYSGMGPQWWGMGRQLLDREPVFAAMMERCAAALRPHSGWSLIDEFRKDEAQSRIAHPLLAQVSNFALQVSLSALWAHWGITPGAVIGHSGGAMAAAHHAGIHTLDEAIWLAFHRSRLQGRDSNAGEMLALGMPAAEAEGLLKGHEDRISIAAINGPAATTLAGDGEVLRALAAALTAKQVFARMLTVTIAYHSPKMDPIKDEFLSAVQGLGARSARLPFVSDTTGTWEDGAACDAAYWWRAIRSPVRFADSIRTLVEAGFTGFVEIAPHPVLANAIGECARAGGIKGLVVPSLRRNEDERAIMLRSLGALYANGTEPAWDALYTRDPSVALPLYPFQRDRHWFEPEKGGGRQAVGEADPNPLLGQRLPGAQPIWEARLEARGLEFVSDHVVQGAVVMPAAGYVAMALAAARRLDPEGSVTLRNLSFQRPLIVGDTKARAQIAVDADTRAFRIDSTAEGRTDWTRHAVGRIGRNQGREAPRVDLAAITARIAKPTAPDAFYAMLGRRGLAYGPRFRGVVALRVGDGEAIATVGPLQDVTADPDSIHPALLDAAFQVLAAVADRTMSADGRLFLPTALREVRLHRPAGDRFHVHCRLESFGAASVAGSFSIVDENGTPLLDLDGLQARLIDSATSAAETAERWFYDYRWEPKPLAVLDAPPRRIALPKRDPGFPDRMRAAALAIEQETRWSDYYREAEPVLSDVAAAHVLAAFAELGLTIAPDSVIDAAAIERLKRSEPSQGRWMDRLLGLLRETGCIAAIDDGWRIQRIPAIEGAAARLPAYTVDLALLAAAGRTLAAALSGETAGRDAVFTQESLPLLERFYRDAPASDHYNRVLVRAVADMLAEGGRAGSLRVLEVGAGTGGATAALLPALPLEHTRYLFTDTAALLLDAARDAFRGTPGIEMRPLDIGRDTASQGLASGSFDLIVAANVVHATADVAMTLGRLRDLLAPGGTLAMIEITRHPRWLDVIFGQTRGWWAFEDRALRPEHPLLESRQWQACLEQAGLADLWMSSEPDAPGEAAQTVILATRPVTEAAPPWIVLGDSAGPAAAVVAALDGFGCASALIESDERVGALLDAGASGLVDMRSIGAGTDYAQAQTRGVGSLLPLFQTLLGRQPAPEIPIWLVTAGAAMLRPEDEGRCDEEGVLSAPIWGFGRTLLKEQPRLALRMADIGSQPGTEAIEALVREFTEHDPDEEVAFDGDTRHVRRLRRLAVGDLPARPPLAGSDLQWRAEIGMSGSLGSLRLRTFRPVPPGTHEVQVAIEAASLNFRDVMLAMGGIPGLEEELSFGRQRLGSDCAGIVTAVGSAVTTLKPGDAVMGMAPGALGSMTTTADHFLIEKPAGLSFAEAAALPTVFITARYALTRLAQLQRGERILIHAAAGGVGLAAIQIARDIGAEIFATAGSDAKRDHLRRLGVTHIMDSRSLAFADEVMALTGGQGVDVVLNSLSGEAIERGIACLAPYGRFVEIGKLDIYSDNPLQLGRFRQNLSYAAFDLDRLTIERPDVVRTVLGELGAALAAERFVPFERHDFAMATMEDAFRLMAQGRHIGKIVLTNDGERPTLAATGGPDCVLRGDGSYLITGGLGGFGLNVAEHLAEGAPGAIVLMGRSASGADAAARIEKLRARGVRVAVMVGDVSLIDDVDAILGRIDAELPPLRGILHCAMVLDDRSVDEMDEASLDKVMAPKALGAWNLHRRTADRPLDHFILFSSIASLLGNPLQANYSAASAFLDALAHHRRALGLPAQTINWGVLGGAGFVADRPELQRFLEQQGYLAFTPAQATDALAIAMRSTAPELMAASIDWRRLADYSPRAAASPRIADLIPAAGTDRRDTQPASAIIATLAQAAPGDRPPLVEDFLIKLLSRVLGMPADGIEPDRPFDELGLDSLLSVEFMMVLSTELRFEMPVIALLDNMSARRLSGLVLAALDTNNVAVAPVTPVVALTLPATATPAAVAAPAALPPTATVVRLPDPPAAVAAPRIDPDPPHDQRWSALQKVSRAISKAGLAALGHVDVQGQEHLPAGPFILAVNHLSMADVPLALTIMPRRTIILATAALQQFWLLDRLVGGIGQAIYVNKTGDVAPALEEALRVLRAGGIIALAPEGKRNRAGLGRGETGVAWLAQQSGLPVVPYAAWGQEQWRGTFRLRRIGITVRIGESIPPLPAGDMRAREFTDRVMTALADLLPEAYRGVYAQRAAAE